MSWFLIFAQLSEYVLNNIETFAEFIRKIVFLVIFVLVLIKYILYVNQWY